MAKRFFLRVTLVLSVLAAGCSSMHTIEPQRIIAPPSEPTPLPTAFVKEGSINCSLAPVVVEGSIPADLQLFAQATYCAYGATTHREEWIRRFVEKGVALSDKSCALFFDDMEYRRVDSGYRQTNMNIAGTAVSAVLAATGNNARSVFNVATALAFGNAWFENYKANYVLTPQLGKLYEKLKTGLRNPVGDRLKEKAAKGDYTSFDLARIDVQDYDELCSHKSITLLLDRAIEAAEIRAFAPSEPSQADLDQSKGLESALYAIANPAGPGTFEEGHLEALYVVESAGSFAKRQEVAAAIKEIISTKLEPLVKNLGLDQETVPPQVSSYFISIASLRRLAESKKVRELRLKVQEYLGAKAEHDKDIANSKTIKDQKESQQQTDKANKKLADALAPIRSDAIAILKARDGASQRSYRGYYIVKPSSDR